LVASTCHCLSSQNRELAFLCWGCLI